MARKFDHRYDFRSAESLRQRDDRRHGTASHDVPSGTTEGQHPCARGPWCAAAKNVVHEDGTKERIPGPTYQAFCQACTDLIVQALTDLPAAFARIEAEYRRPARRGGSEPVRTPFGPSVPIRLDVDALQREAPPVIGGWAARVRSVPGLWLSAPQHDNPATLEGFAEACKVLRLHPGPLLSLQPGWMTRMYTFPAGKPGATPTQEGTCRRCGHRIARLVTSSRLGGKPRWYVTDATGPVACTHEPREITSSRALALMSAELEDEISGDEIVAMGDGWVQVGRFVDGTDAGHEIIGLAWRSTAVLGELRAKPQELMGVPCRADGYDCPGVLVRAEPPPDPEDPGFYSVCLKCRDRMREEEYREWVALCAAYERNRRKVPTLENLPGVA